MIAFAGLAYVCVTAAAVAFQVALALGAPWGAYAMGGAVPGRFPARLRAAALVQAVVLALLGLIVAAKGGLVGAPSVFGLPWLVWVVVAVSAVSLVLNAISRSPGERRIWVPVAVVMLGSSVVVALGAP